MKNTQKSNSNLYAIEDAKSGSRLVYDASIGTLIAFEIDGRNILYFNQSRGTSDNPIDLGGIPALFPVCGSLLNDSYKLGKESFYMPKHGFAFGTPWKAEASQEQEGGRITAEFQSNDTTLRMYPFRFILTFHYRLRSNELLIEQIYANEGPGSMPFYSGLHPYFSVACKDSLILDINSGSYLEDSTGKLVERPYKGTIDFNDMVDFIFRLQDRGGNTYSIKDPVSNRRVVIETGEEFSRMVMWTADRESPFLCLEPWMAEPDALNQGDGVRHVEPGKSLKTWIRIRVA